MDDFYYPHHRNRRQLLRYPYYENYGEALSPLSGYFAAACAAKDREPAGDWEEESSVERATRAHVEVTREHEKVKERLEEAKKKFEESEAKVKEATKELQKAKKNEYNKIRGYW